jgi:hypothetical protein
MRSLVLCSLVLVFTGCFFEPRDDDSPNVRGPLPDASYCPAVSPQPGTYCNTPASTHETCTYLIEACSCGPSDIEWSCRCEDNAWSCVRGYDCYPCPDAAIQDAYVPPDSFIPPT